MMIDPDVAGMTPVRLRAGRSRRSPSRRRRPAPCPGGRGWSAPVGRTARRRACASERRSSRAVRALPDEGARRSRRQGSGSATWAAWIRRLDPVRVDSLDRPDRGPSSRAVAIGTATAGGRARIFAPASAGGEGRRGRSPPRGRPRRSRRRWPTRRSRRPGRCGGQRAGRAASGRGRRRRHRPGPRRGARPVVGPRGRRRRPGRPRLAGPPPGPLAIGRGPRAGAGPGPGASTASPRARDTTAARACRCSEEVGGAERRRRSSAPGPRRPGRPGASVASAPRPPAPGHGPLALGRPEPLLDAREVGRQPVGHDAGVARAVARARAPGSRGPGRSARRRPRRRRAGRGRRPGRPAPPCAGSRRGPAGEGGLAGEDLAEDRAEARRRRPARRPVDLAPGLLRGHVRGVPITEPASERSASVPLRAVAITVSSASSLPASRVVGRAAPGQDLGQAPVHHLDLAEGADHHVGGLQVAVDHPPGVGVGHRLGDIARRSPGTGAGPSAGSGRSARSSARVRPLTSFMAKYGRRSAKVPSS